MPRAGYHMAGEDTESEYNAVTRDNGTIISAVTFPNRYFQVDNY